MAQSTSVVTPVVDDAPSTEPEAPTLTFPVGWLMDHATPPIVARAYGEVAGLDRAAFPGMELFPYMSPVGITLASTQSIDGTWNGAMLSLPAAHGGIVEGVGTIPAVRRLVELAWDREAPPLAHARRILFRILAEDNDPRFLYEMAPGAKTPEMANRGRTILREAAAAALAQAGYEADPRLRGAARRILDRIGAFLASPLAEKPWIRIGNRHVLSGEACPPSIYALTMLAHMPIFRSEHYPEMEQLYLYLTQPKPTQESVQVYGRDIISQPHLVLGDLLHNRNVVDADVPFALYWLETMARLNFLKRNDNWVKMFERLVDDRDRSCVWHPHKGSEAPSTSNPYVWPYFPLEPQLVGEAQWTDVTFRIGLIAKLLGWNIQPV